MPIADRDLLVAVSCPAVSTVLAWSLLVGQCAAVAAMVRVIRRHVLWRDWAIAYRVMLDGREVTSVRNKETVEGEVTPGAHVLRIKLGWGGSPELRFALRNGQVAKFVCRPSVQMFTTPMGMFARDRWVDLAYVGSSVTAGTASVVGIGSRPKT